MEVYNGTECSSTHHTLITTGNKIRNIVSGTDLGNIKIYNLPFLSQEFYEFNAHLGPIT